MIKIFKNKKALIIYSSLALIIIAVAVFTVPRFRADTPSYSTCEADLPSGDDSDSTLSTECQGTDCARAADPTTSVSITDYPTEVTYTPGEIKDIALGTISSSDSSTHHISIFMSKANYTFSPTADDTGKSLICTEAAARANIYLIGQITCPDSGECTDSSQTWTTSATTTAGRHQIFAVAMDRDTSDSGCLPEAILSWSAPTTQIDLQAPVPSGTNSDKIHLEGFTADGSAITDMNKLKKDQAVTFHVRLDPIYDDSGALVTINHVSLLVSKPDDTNTPDYSSGLTRATLCSEATHAPPCTHLCPISLYKTCASGTCEPFEWTPSETGQHRLIAMAMTSPDGSVCQPAGVAGYNGATVVRVLNADGTDPDAGGGGGGGDITPPTSPIKLTNPSTIESISDLIDKIIFWAMSFVGIIAFSAFVVAGFIYMTAGGDESKMAKAKKAMVFAVVGMVIAVLAYAIMYNLIVGINSWGLPSAHSVRNCFKDVAGCIKFK